MDPLLWMFTNAVEYKFFYAASIESENAVPTCIAHDHKVYQYQYITKHTLCSFASRNIFAFQDKFTQRISRITFVVCIMQPIWCMEMARK